MSTQDPTTLEEDDAMKISNSGNEKAIGTRDESPEKPLIGPRVDLLAKQSTDLALDAKMHIVNNVRTGSIF